MAIFGETIEKLFTGKVTRQRRLFCKENTSKILCAAKNEI